MLETTHAAAERAAGNVALVKAMFVHGQRIGAIDAWIEIHAERQWLALGYHSWDELCADHFDGHRIALPAPERREAVAGLRDAGMSTRAIASVVGVSDFTVRQDLKSGAMDHAPEVRGLDGKTYSTAKPAAVTGEVLTAAEWQQHVDEPQTRAENLMTAEEQHLLNTYENSRRGLVINMSRDGHPHLWEWAQLNGVAVRIDRRTDWGNPFEIPGDGDRHQVIRAYMRHYLPNKPSLLGRLPELRGKILGCWCHPEPCHGHILLDEAWR
jgi:transposase